MGDFAFLFWVTKVELFWTILVSPKYRNRSPTAGTDHYAKLEIVKGSAKSGWPLFQTEAVSFIAAVFTYRHDGDSN